MFVSVAFLGLVGCSQAPKAKVGYADNGKPNAQQPVRHQRNTSVAYLQRHGVSVIATGETVRMVLPSDALFVDGSANIQQAYANRILPKIGRYIKTFDTENITITAYSDSTATHGVLAQRKRALTDRQAQVVASQLWSSGLDTRLLMAKGYGADHAIAWNGTLEGRKDNRRVEINFNFYPKYEVYN